jgi:hypothetical protein
VDDSALPGAATACRRLASWAQATELAVVAEVAARTGLASPQIAIDGLATTLNGTTLLNATSAVLRALVNWLPAAERPGVIRSPYLAGGYPMADVPTGRTPKVITGQIPPDSALPEAEWKKIPLHLARQIRAGLGLGDMVSEQVGLLPRS